MGINLKMRSSILCLLETGKSQREVARILNVAQSSVNYIWKRFLETVDIKDRPKLEDQVKRPLNTKESFVVF